MIGSTVQKGFDKWGGNPGSALVGDNSTSLNATALFNDTALVNGTGGVPRVVENDEEAMSPEELSVRLGYAMSLTFMVGIIQVYLKIVVAWPQNHVFGICLIAVIHIAVMFSSCSGLVYWTLWRILTKRFITAWHCRATKSYTITN